MENTAPRPEPDLALVSDKDGGHIAIRHRAPRGDRPTIVFLPGYASDMAGQKALAIDQYCASRGLGCLRFDYSGTGQSSGAFADGTLERWLGEVIAMIDGSVPRGRILLAGSSMGGWLALHAALRRPTRITAVLGIAAAPDFTDWGFSDEDKSVLEVNGKLERSNPYGPEPSVTYLGFWRSGEALKLLGAPIDLAIPVRLVHGTADDVVPVSVALCLLEQLDTPDAQLRLIKGAGHRLSETAEIDAILAELDQLVALT